MTKRTAFGPELFEGLEKWRAPRADHQHRSEEHHCVDAEAAAGLDPVDVWVEVEPEGKLVQRERCAHAISNAHDAAEQDGERRVCATKIEQPAVADHQQDEDSPNQVVNVPAAHHHPIEWAIPFNDKGNQQPHAEKSDEEGDPRQKETPPRTVRDGCSNQIPKPRQLQNYQQDGGNCQNEQQKYEASGLGHKAY